jgi:DNA-binding beta-propeller fold protein YncE
MMKKFLPSLIVLFLPVLINSTCQSSQGLDDLARDYTNSITATRGTEIDQVTLKWEKVPGAVKYEIFRSLNSNSDFSKIGETVSSIYGDSSGIAMTVYYYKVRTVFTDGNYSDFNQPIEGYRGEIYEFVRKWGSNGTAAGQFNKPKKIAIDSKGNCYIVDNGNHRIQKFDSQGNFIAKWGKNSGEGTSGSAPGEFFYPDGIAVHENNNSIYIYIGDTMNHRIQKLNSQGQFILEWGINGTGDGDFSNPRGITVDEQGYVYVTDTNNNRIQKFDSSGNFITKWDSTMPLGIESDKNGFLYVAEGHPNNRIRKFDSNGNDILQWGADGTNPGQFKTPHDIAIDSDGYIYVADFINYRVQKFTSSGSYITLWGARDQNGNGDTTEDGDINYINGVGAGPNGEILVADMLNHRIQVFKKRD